jgi:hypothetical protein
MKIRTIALEAARLLALPRLSVWTVGTTACP